MYVFEVKKYRIFNLLQQGIQDVNLQKKNLKRFQDEFPWKNPWKMKRLDEKWIIHHSWDKELKKSSFILLSWSCPKESLLLVLLNFYKVYLDLRSYILFTTDVHESLNNFSRIKKNLKRNKKMNHDNIVS